MNYIFRAEIAPKLLLMHEQMSGIPASDYTDSSEKMRDARMASLRPVEIVSYLDRQGDAKNRVL